MDHTIETTQNKILTIPNILSVIRLCLIPLIIWLYCGKENYFGAAIILLVSGFTDILDGFIARHFHMISNLGKALDPVADKLTQGAMLICLLTNFSFMWIPLVLLIVKETFAAITGLMVIKKTGKVIGAEWHGKLVTCMIYATIMIHFVWNNIPLWVSGCFVGGSILVMVYSCVRYGIRNYKLVKQNINEKSDKEKQGC